MSIAVKVMGVLVSFVARLVTGAQGHWTGSPPEALQRIYFANHQSHLDWVLIWAALPNDLRVRTRPIAARDYWTAGKFKHWLTREVFHAVYVSAASAPTTRTRWSRWSRRWNRATRWSSFPKARAATRASRCPSRAGCTTWPSSSPACS